MERKMEEKKSSTWGIQVTPETREQINQLLGQVGGKNKKESFENMLGIVEFHVTRGERKPELDQKMKELNDTLFALRDTVQDLIKAEDQELHASKEQLEAMKKNKEKLEADVKALKKENKELKKELELLREINRLSKKQKITDGKREKNKQDQKVKDSGQMYLKLDAES